MCSRFFIDFSDLNQQRNKLESYLLNHFNGDDRTKTQYLMRLYKIVDESTVCLMSHERRLTLALIEELAYRFFLRSQQPGATSPHAPHPHYQLHLQQHYKPNQTATQFFPHIHHHLIPRPHTHYDLIVASQPSGQATATSPTATTAGASTTSTTSSSSASDTVTSPSGGSPAAKSTTHSGRDGVASSKASSNHPANAQQSTHSNSHSNNHASTANCKSSTKNQQQQSSANAGSSNQQSQQQHIQQQYHAYLFGTGANTFYYSPYHHHHNYQPHNGCLNSLGCQCGVWTLGCA